MKSGNPTLFEPLNASPALPEGVIFRPKVAASALQQELLDAVDAVAGAAPFRRPSTPGGGMTSAAMTNAGAAGWWSDRAGYRYVRTQPDTDLPWPALPTVFRAAVALAVDGTPWSDFQPDVCLINFYEPGARMGLHQDRDERDLRQPIVTVSLGDDADFLIGGQKRSDRTIALVVASGDAVIMGPPGRMLFHGIRKIYPGTGPLLKLDGRVSLTFRKAL